jgi:hypothetical protein
MRDTPKNKPDFFVSVSDVDFLKAHIKIIGRYLKKGWNAHKGTFSHFELFPKNGPILSTFYQIY